MTKFSPLPHPGHLGSDYTPSLTGKRILIVDDSAACRMVQEAMAKAMGAFVETAETAVQAMVASDASTFDLIILDIGRQMQTVAFWPERCAKRRTVRPLRYCVYLALADKTGLKGRLSRARMRSPKSHSHQLPRLAKLQAMRSPAILDLQK
jgi:response regulator RpfG family c-di-GMP phosphodiesterase